jgi:GTP-binding protein
VGAEDPRPRPDGRPRVAIVGRQNVGKSTLLNRLLGAREAISDEEPGVTRDRLEIPVRWRGRTFLAVDTGGYVRRASGIEALVSRQAERAAEEADLVLLVVDAEIGIQEEDAALARRLRAAPVPVVLVANKVDSEHREPAATEFYKLGLGEPVPVSALHGRNAGELLDRVVAILEEAEPQGEDETQGRVEGAGEEADEPEPQPEGEAVFAIVGRPNVGKSSLFNRLVGEERAVVFPEAGTTRDAVDSLVSWDGRELRFVDTAGFRRPSRAQGVDYYGYLRAVRAIDRSHVAALVVDAEEGVTTEDRKIAAKVGEAGRGLVVAANKWDLVPSGERGERFEMIRERLAVFPSIPVVRTSALTGLGTAKVIPTLLAVHEEWLHRVPTSGVNEVVRRAQDEHPPPRTAGRLLYATQVGVGPPRFVVFASGPVPPRYARFLENRLRKEFGFAGAPIRITFRRRRRR